MATVTRPTGQQNFAGHKSHIGYFANSKLNQRVDSSLSPGKLVLSGIICNEEDFVRFLSRLKMPVIVFFSPTQGFLLLLGSYMHLGWSFWSLIHIWMSDIASYPSASDTRFAVVMTVTAWFIGAINGCIIAGYVLRNLPNTLSNVSDGANFDFLFFVYCN